MKSTEAGQMLVLIGVIAIFTGLLWMAGWQWALIITGSAATLAGAVMSRNP